MKLSNLRPFVPSGKDYALAKAFFLDIGFVDNWSDEALCELQFGDAKFLLQNFQHEEMQKNFMVYVNVDDLDAFYEHLVKLDLSRKYPGVKCSRPEKRPWGIRELHLIDPAGVCWHFA
ncbi:MAG: hypothetical protein V4628_01250 [Pseudomonadota bacterium]